MAYFHTDDLRASRVNPWVENGTVASAGSTLRILVRSSRFSESFNLKTR